MATTLTINPTERFDTMGGVLAELGDVPPNRVLLRPAPGSATEADLLDLLDHEDRACELIDGILVEKPMGWLESILASELGHLLSQHVKSRKLGLISGEQAPIRLRLGLVRMPDIAFTAWSRIPGKPADVAPIAPIIPNLAVEILSLSNTRAEMTRKCQEYFAAGVELVWIIDPAARTIEIYTAPGGPVRTLTHADTLTGDPVLPQFSMRIADLFAGLDRPDLPAGAGQRE